MKSRDVNRVLFEKRLELGLSLKDAATSLGISSFKLNLIESGLLAVSDKLKYSFIENYKLDKRFLKKIILLIQW